MGKQRNNSTVPRNYHYRTLVIFEMLMKRNATSIPSARDQCNRSYEIFISFVLSEAAMMLIQIPSVYNINYSYGWAHTNKYSYEYSQLTGEIFELDLRCLRAKNLRNVKTHSFTYYASLFIFLFSFQFQVYCIFFPFPRVSFSFFFIFYCTRTCSRVLLNFTAIPWITIARLKVTKYAWFFAPNIKLEKEQRVPSRF